MNELIEWFRKRVVISDIDKEYLEFVMKEYVMKCVNDESNQKNIVNKFLENKTKQFIGENSDKEIMIDKNGVNVVEYNNDRDIILHIETIEKL